MMERFCRLQKTSFILLAAILLGLPNLKLVAQTPSEEFQQVLKRYPNEFYLYTKRAKTYHMSIEDKALKITAETEDELMILKEFASMNTEETVEYSPLFQVSNIEAYTLVPTEKKYKRVAITPIQDRHKFDNSIFHDDISEKVFDYNELQKGAKRYLKYTTTYEDPKMLNGFFFGYTIPTDQVLFKIECDNAIELGYKEFNTAGFSIKLNIDKQKTKTIYTWTCDTMAKTKLYDNGPSFRSVIPHVEVFIKSYTIDGVQKKMLENADDLHNYYSNYLKDLNQEISTPLKSVTDSLIKDKKTEIERVKAIFYWVKSNIKYVAFEDGYGGYIPRQASDVCDKKYGDCKDMASITHAMLQYAQVKNTFLTWIGTREIPYNYEDLPTGSVDNHMIVTYKAADSTYFLDATSQNTPFGYPTAFIQGKEAMLHIDKEHYEIIRVPEMPSNKNEYSDSVYIEVKGDTLFGHGYAKLTGYVRDYYLDRVYELQGEEKMKDVKSFLEKGNNKFYLVSYEEINRDDRDKPLEINFTFTLNNYVIQSGNDQFVNLFLERPMLGGKIDDDRKVDIEYEYKNRNNYIVTFKIPEGYKSKYIAKTTDYNNDLYGFHATFNEANNCIELRYQLDLKALLLKQNQFSIYNDYFAFLKKQYAENISITKK